MLGMLFQEPALLCGDSSRVLCFLYLGQRRVTKIGLYSTYCRGYTAITHVPAHSTGHHSFPLVDITVTYFLPHRRPPSPEQHLMNEGWIFLLTFFAACSDAPVDEVNPNFRAFPCEANDFSFDKRHLVE